MTTKDLNALGFETLLFFYKKINFLFKNFWKIKKDLFILHYIP